LLDAHYYDDALKVYEARPQGLEKPVPSRGLEALLPVARRTMPLLVPAESQREVLRMLDIADETEVNCIIVGGYEAAELAAELNQRKTPVVVSLNFPGLEADQHPEMEVALDILRFREHAPKAAGELARAGVRMAFASAGLKNGSSFLANLRLAVKQGLPRDAALRAATLTTAEILGVDERLGSVQQGKMANLIVADGDLFADQTRIQSVYVSGARFDVEPTTIAAARPALNPATPPTPRPTVAATPREVLIKNATVMTVTRGTIKGGSVLVRDGKIAAVGTAATVSAGAGALVIDATGKWVTPGLIDEHAHYPTDSHNEATQQFTSMTRLRDNLNPTDVALYRVLASGVTTINVYHGSVNPIGGQPVVIKARWGKDAHGLLFEGARPGLKMSAEEFPASRTNGAPTSYAGEEAVICDILSRAQQYRQQWDAYAKQRASGVAPLLPLRRDLAMEALVEVLKGERAVHVHSLSGPVDDERPMLMMMRLAEEFGFRIKTFEHAAPAFRVADELRNHGAGASLFALFSAQTAYNASVLMHKGVTVSINSDGEGLARDLNQQAGLLTRFGLTADEALALVTINPARQLDIDMRVGSIEVGKDADLVVWTHDPLGIYSVADTVLIDGQVYFTREYDKAQRAWLEAERKRLTVPTASPTAQWHDRSVPSPAGRPAMEVTHGR
jgi:imidazolonepropionase-like amidohydrolase